jgi:hypothetical protein
MQEYTTEDLDKILHEEPAMQDNLGVEEPEDKQEPDQAQKTDTEKNPDDFEFDASKFEGKDPEELIKEIAAREKEVVNQRRLIGKQSQEVGAARQKERELLSQISLAENKLNELKVKEAEIDTENYDEHVIEVYKAENNLKQSRIELQASQTEQWAKARFEDLDTLISDVVPEIIKEDLQGTDQAHRIDEYVREFKSGNWKVADQNFIDNVFSRAEAKRKEVSSAAALKIENDRLKKQLEELSKSPDILGKKIAAVANQTTNFRQGNAGPVNTDLNSLTLEDCNKLLAKTK